MLSNVETPRPLPPAKTRRATSNQRPRTSSTPPPAYGSPFTYPTRRTQSSSSDDLLGLSAPSRMVDEWDAGHLEPPRELGDDEDLVWLDGRSQDELADLLVKADDMIKERENDLGLASEMCKTLYQDNAALRSKHEALLARLPVSPEHFTSSGTVASISHSQHPIAITHSTSDSGINLLHSAQRPPYFRSHLRKVSMSAADVSYLADQNAELLEKLEKLELEATSADQAGRRELKRLEKEISFLRDALEKTQAKSEELEGKVQDAVVGEVWRKKEERDAKVRAIRQLGRHSGESQGRSEIRNFAPSGSKFGGPSGSFPLFPRSEGVSEPTHTNLPSYAQPPSQPPSPVAPPENTLIIQLLTKVKELEETNNRILRQQAETSKQLSAVQRDAENMNKVYECLVDPNSTNLEPEGGDSADFNEPYSSQTVKSRSFPKTLEKERSTILPDLSSTHSKARKSVMGLFDDPSFPSFDSDASNNTQLNGATGSSSFTSSVWSEGSHPTSMAESAPLSPLHFFSPPPHSLHDMLPIGPTLQSELDEKLGGGPLSETWDTSQDHYHHRTSSLFDLSQFSVPPSPSPLSRTQTGRQSDELHYPTDNQRDTAPLMGSTGIQLSIDSSRCDVVEDLPHNSSRLSASQGPKSPRMQAMMETLRSRNGRWANRRFPDTKPSEPKTRERRLIPKSRSVRAPKRVPSLLQLPQRLSSAVDNMLDQLDNIAQQTATGKDEDNDVDSPDNSDYYSPPDSPTEASSPQRLSSDNALQLHVQRPSEKEKLKEKEDRSNGSIVLEIWLWIQFALIVFVFVWNVAKRGPRNVIGETDRNVVAKRR